MNSKEAEAFDLSKEPTALREAYGRNVFGQGCLLARRLIEQGVTFVEVSLGTSSGGAGWDTHADNFNAVKALSTDLDNGWATLMKDLADRGLLESTTILWMGEFGRTPQINNTGDAIISQQLGLPYLLERASPVVRPTVEPATAAWPWKTD